MPRFGYRKVGVAGVTSLTLGYIILVTIRGSGHDLIVVIVSGFAIGLGMGLASITTLTAAQATVPLQRVGVATSTIMLFRTFGGAFAVSVMGTVMLTFMQQGLIQLRAAHQNVSDTLWAKIASRKIFSKPRPAPKLPRRFWRVDEYPRGRALVCLRNGSGVDGRGTDRLLLAEE